MVDNRNIKDRLNDYRYLSEEIRELRREIEELKTELESAPLSYSFTPKGKSGDPDPQGSIKALMIDKVDSLHKALAEDKKEREALLKLMWGLSYQHRRLIWFRYIKNMYWEDICVRMSYSWRHVHRMHSEILKEMEKMAHYAER